MEKPTDPTLANTCNDCKLTEKGKRTLNDKIQRAIIHLTRKVSRKENEIQDYKSGIAELTAVSNSVEAGILPASVVSLLEKLID
jgi:hypothetical protein